ncbi:protein phosphatase CheZ [Rhodocaloribacter litoris]|uniref:protein phosphatase CheZ n=1 Tax=Rhodocaloribacter litoris TaxID=2558931 RepID=UPI00142384C7|nr:protein phosphatase CheZ [Rhodocaloribacter litoris]QXD16054.1 protein phosphatase CheZ [Rhodocaloribacter litoris]
MGSLPLNDILQRLDDLRSVFILGQRAMPFVEEVLAFLREVVPVLDEVDSSIRVSTNKVMPTATSRLASVNEATELATTEIMDLVDETQAKVEQTRTRIEAAHQDLHHLDETDRQLAALIRERLDDPDLLREMETHLAQKNACRSRIAETLAHKLETLEEIHNNMNRIMMALQVQDITAQQIASVSHLIESVRAQLARFEGRLGAGTLEDFLDTTLPEGGTFDGNATYDRSGKKQKLADAIISSMAGEEAPAPGTEDATPTSQDEIDALFGNSQPASQDEIDNLFGAGDGASPKAASQDEIDNLFGNGQPAPQDEIDNLFGGNR